MRKERLLYIATIAALVLFLGLIGNGRANIGNVFSTKAQKVLEAMFDASGDISTITFANKETIKNSTDRRIMLGSDTTTTGVFGLILDAGSTGTVDIDVCLYFSDDGTDTANSICWEDGAEAFTPNRTWLFRTGINVDADISITFGSQAVIRYEESDANANALLIYGPEGGATHVPVTIFGDASTLNADLGFFNGVTDPSIALISDDAGDYMRLFITDARVGTINIQGTAVLQMTTTEVRVPDAVYLAIGDNNAGAPAAGDCDADAEIGRLSIDTTNNLLYVCNGATRGWDTIALTN